MHESEPDNEVDSGTDVRNDKTSEKLEQWKFYGQSTQRVSDRRLKNNRFYVRLLIALLGAASIGGKLGYLSRVGIFSIGVIGFFFCIFWLFHILSYQQLNSGKYRVLSELADDLPYRPFQMEWDRLKKGESPSTYIKHTSVEAWWPRFLAPIYLTMTLWGLLSIAEKTEKFRTVLIIVGIVWSVYAVWVLIWGGPLKTFWRYTGTDADQ